MVTNGGYTELIHAGEGVEIENGVISATGGGGGAELPEVTNADNGDVLTVVNGEWSKAAPTGDSLPEVTNADDGDVLTVVDGEWSKATPASGLTLYGPYYAEYNGEDITLNNGASNPVDLTLLSDPDGNPVVFPAGNFNCLLHSFTAPPIPVCLTAINSPVYYEGQSIDAFMTFYNADENSKTISSTAFGLSFYSDVEFPAAPAVGD